ncbi:MAG: HEAT repeat domain-containing protein [Planctomycetota bacterium]
MALTLPVVAAADSDEFLIEDEQLQAFLQEHVPEKPETPEPPGKEERTILVDLLQKGDPAETERVAWILGDWKGPNNVEPLLSVTEHDSANVQIQSAESLGHLSAHIRDEDRNRTISRLLELTLSENNEVVAAAVDALGQLQAQKARTRIGKSTQSDDPAVKIAAIRALGRIGDRKSMKTLRPALEADSTRTRKHAIRAISRLGDPAFAEEIIPFLENARPALQIAAIKAVVRLKATEEQDALIDLLQEEDRPAIRRTVLQALVSLGGEDHREHYLQHTDDPHHSVRQLAVETIGRFQIEEGAQLLGERLSDDHKHVRDAAVDALVDIGSDKVEKVAANALDSASDPARAASSEVLGRMKSPRRAEVHAQLLEDNYLPARRRAAWAMGEIGYKDAGSQLYETAFKEEADDMVRAAGIISMGKLGHDEVLSKCRTLLPQKPTNSDPGEPTVVRRASARAMGYLEDTANCDPLLQRLNDVGGDMPETGSIRLESAVALGRIGDEQALDDLREYMESEDSSPDIRAACQWAIGQITGDLPDLELATPDPPQPDYFIRPAD